MSNESKNDLIAELRREVRAAQSVVAAVDHAVAERLGLSRSAVTTVLDRLEQRRYVRRRTNPDDRRQVVTELTPLLYRRARELYGDGDEHVTMLGRYSVDELALLLEFVRRDRELNEG